MPIDPRIPLMVKTPTQQLQGLANLEATQANNKLLGLQMQYAQEDRPMQQRAAELDIKKAELGVADISDLTQAEDARRLITLGDRDGAIAALRADGPDDRVGNQLADMLEAGDAEQVIGALDELQVELPP
jgi:hypothetical protein